jgi:hypothetical protein
LANAKLCPSSTQGILVLIGQKTKFLKKQCLIKEFYQTCGGQQFRKKRRKTMLCYEIGMIKNQTSLIEIK